MFRPWKWYAALSLVAMVAAGLACAQPASVASGAAGEAPDRKADEQAIRDVSQALARAFEQGDAKAFAAFWTEEGEYLGEDEPPIQGRAAVEAAYTAFFGQRKAVKAESKTTGIRFLGRDTAIEEGTFTVSGESAATISNKFSALYARQGGKWLVALLKEWSAEPPPPKGLDELAFLIGAWESDGGKARTTYEWCEGKKFIRSQYTIAADGKTPASSGMQIIGADPATGQLRAWTFDAGGSIGEASWDYDGTRWEIRSTGLASGGGETTALNFLTRAGDDAFTWRSVERTAAGVSLPDIGPITVKRTK